MRRRSPRRPSRPPCTSWPTRARAGSATSDWAASSIATPSRRRGKGCKGQWYRVFPMGYVCTDEATIDLDTPARARRQSSAGARQADAVSLRLRARDLAAVPARAHPPGAAEERVQAGRAPELVRAEPERGAKGRARRQRRAARRTRCGRAWARAQAGLQALDRAQRDRAFWRAQRQRVRSRFGSKVAAKSPMFRATTCPNTRISPIACGARPGCRSSMPSTPKTRACIAISRSPWTCACCRSAS